MGLPREQLPDSFLRRVTPEDRERLMLPKPMFPEVFESMAVAKEVPKAAQPKKPAKVNGTRYNLPVVLAFFKEVGLPEPVPEFRFHPERLWRFDFCFVEAKLAVEVNGALFNQGRHTRGAALLLEYEKLSEAAAMGYRVIFTTPMELCLTTTTTLIRRALDWKP